MDKKSELSDKQKTLQKLVEAWAEENQVLGDKERIVLTLEIKGKQGKRAKVLNEKLAKKDWKIIMGVRWNEIQQKTLELFKKIGNNPFTARGVAKQLGQNRCDGGLFDYINTVFRRENLPYRIMTFGKLGGQHYYPDKPQKLVVTDRK